MRCWCREQDLNLHAFWALDPKSNASANSATRPKDGLIFRPGAGAVNSRIVMVISKSLERTADHATNIGEEVVYLCEGRDIRHPGKGQAAAQAETERGEPQ